MSSKHLYYYLLISLCSLPYTSTYCAQSPAQPGMTAWSIVAATANNIVEVETATNSKINQLVPNNSLLPGINSKVSIILQNANTILSQVCAIESKTDQLGINNSLLPVIDSKADVIITNQSLLPVINSKVNAIAANQSLLPVINGKVDAIQSSDNTINSKIDIIDNLITDLINTETTAFDGFVSVFGDKIADGRDDYISIAFQYGIIPIETTTSVANGGFVTSFTSMAVVRTNGAVNSTASVQSKRQLRYRAGHEGYALFTAAFTGAIAANTTQWIGLIDIVNAAAVGYNGTNFSVLFRSNGVDYITPQSSFNIDKLDGTGPSGFTIDTTKLNVFRISYGWLGAAPYSFRVLTTTGQWVLFHQTRQPNMSAFPSVTNPILPIRTEVTDNAGGNVLELRSASWNAGIVGTKNNAGHRYFSLSSQASLPLLVETQMLTIRNKTTYQGKPNHVELRIAAFGGGSLENNTEAVLLVLHTNPSFTGVQTFTDVSTQNSIVEYSTNGIYTAGTGFEIFAYPATRYTSVAPIFIPSADFEIILLPGEMLSVIGQSLTATTNSICSLSWEERF